MNFCSTFSASLWPREESLRERRDDLQQWAAGQIKNLAPLQQGPSLNGTCFTQSPNAFINSTHLLVFVRFPALWFFFYPDLTLFLTFLLCLTTWIFVSLNFSKEKILYFYIHLLTSVFWFVLLGSICLSTGTYEA